METVNIRVLLMTEGKSYVAQCLEYDITAHGKSSVAALQALLRAIIGQTCLEAESTNEPPGPHILRRVKAAPPAYEFMFELATSKDEQLRAEVKMTLPPGKTAWPAGTITEWIVDAVVRIGLSPYTKMAQA